MCLVVRPKAASADSHRELGSVDDEVGPVNVWNPAPAGMSLRVAHLVAIHRPLATDVTFHTAYLLYLCNLGS